MTSWQFSCPIMLRECLVDNSANYYYAAKITTLIAPPIYVFIVFPSFFPIFDLDKQWSLLKFTEWSLRNIIFEFILNNIKLKICDWRRSVLKKKMHCRLLTIRFGGGLSLGPCSDCEQLTAVCQYFLKKHGLEDVDIWKCSGKYIATIS